MLAAVRAKTQAQKASQLLHLGSRALPATHHLTWGLSGSPETTGR